MSPVPSLPARVAGAALRAATLALLAAHVGLTALYNTPTNPLRIAAAPLLDRTIGAYFAQNWALFAPDPVSDNVALLARPLRAAEAASSGPLPRTGWYDLSTPLWRRWQRDRFSAYDRIARPQAHTVRTVLGGGPHLRAWTEACRRGDRAACARADRMLADARTGAARRLERLGAAFCADLRLPPDGCAAVAFRARERRRVPWSARHGGRPAVREIDLGVHPAPAGVVRSGIFAAEGRR